MENEKFLEILREDLLERKELVLALKKADVESSPIYWVLRSSLDLDKRIKRMVVRIVCRKENNAIPPFEKASITSRIKNIVNENNENIQKAISSLSSSAYHGDAPTGWIEIQYNKRAKKIVYGLIFGEVNKIIERFIFDCRPYAR